MTFSKDIDTRKYLACNQAFADYANKETPEGVVGLTDFAITVFDLNDLKKINDTKGHQAGDGYICNGCKLICQKFKHSPVFRIGGDEFVAVSCGEDYENIEELMNSFAEHNAESRKNGGLVIACGMTLLVLIATTEYYLATICRRGKKAN